MDTDILCHMAIRYVTSVLPSWYDILPSPRSNRCPMSRAVSCRQGNQHIKKSAEDQTEKTGWEDWQDWQDEQLSMKGVAHLAE